MTREKTLIDIQSQIKNEFGCLGDSDDKWAYLLKIAKDHPIMNQALVDDKFLVSGCATRLYCVPEFIDGKLILHLDTEQGGDNPMIVRGLAALASRVYSEQSPADILAADP